MNKKDVTILIVEDDEADIELAKRAFRKVKLEAPVLFAKDGVEALEYLRSEGNSTPRVERPFLILTDLNMPRMDGIELLKNIRMDPKLADSIVFVLTTSDIDRDRCAAYDKNVAGYIVKGHLGEHLETLVKMLDHFLKIVKFP